MRDDSKMTYIIRKSFPLLVIRIILAELILEGIYVGWRFGIDFLPIETDVKVLFHAITTGVFIVVTILQIILLVVIFSKWMNEYYELQDDEIIQWTGILTKRGKSYQYNNLQSLTVHQSILGRLLKYGTVSMYVPALGQDLDFTEVPKPFAFVELIKQHFPKGDGQKFLFKRK